MFELKDPLDTVLALDVDDAVTDDEVVKEAEAAAVEGVAVDFPEVDADRKDEAVLRDAVAEEVLAPANDSDFPEIVSYPLRQRLMVHGVVADPTLPVPGVATEEDGWALAEEREDIKRCWLLQGEHLRPGGVLIASRRARAGCAL